MNPFDAVAAAFVAFLITVGPSAAGATVVVDTVRSVLNPGKTWPSYVWLLTSLVVGIGIALLFQLNFVGPLVIAVPAIASQADHLIGTWGQVLTGLGIAGASGYWHDMRAVRSAAAAASRATVN